jgi:uncharacterized protein YciI
MATHHILFYDYVPDVAERRGPYRDAHLARIGSERQAGRIVMAGALGSPPHGAVIVFADTSPEQIEEFALGDPYVEAGLVTARRIEPYTVV